MIRLIRRKKSDHKIILIKQTDKRAFCKVVFITTFPHGYHYKRN